MRRYFKIVILVLAIAITAIALTSGGSKEFGRSKDLVEELYYQAITQNDTLKSIEENIATFRKNKNDALAAYRRFTSYNNRYYSAAKAKAAGIVDVATRQQANDCINKSEAAYNTKITGWQNSITALNAKERALDDLHELLQVIATEPLIAKYQLSDFPGDSNFKEVDRELLKVIEKIKAITK